MALGTGGSRGYNTRASVASAPSAFAIIYASDFGQVAPGLVNGNLAYNAGAGSLAMGTAFAKITWITAEGESLPSAEASVVISAATGAFTITQPSVPTNGATVIGWRVYSAGTTGLEALNAAANSTTQVQQNFTTARGVIAGFPVSQTTVQVKIYGAGASVPAIDGSGIQTDLPSISANSTANYFAVVPNTSSQWKVQKAVEFMNSDGTLQTSGITLNGIVCVQPVYPGTSQVVSAGTYIVLNGYVFVAAVGGTTASTFIGFSAFSTTKYANTTDGTVTWQCLGKAALLRFQFANVSGSGAVPVAQTYELFQF